MRFTKIFSCALIVLAAGVLMPRTSSRIDGNPLKEITAVRRVVFVMKGGMVYKSALNI